MSNGGIDEAKQRARPPSIVLTPGMPVAAAATHALQTGLAALKFYEPAALQGEIEGIHQFRVSVRRLRAAVELFVPVLHANRVQFYRADLPLVGHCAGAARDGDVLQDLIRSNAKALDPMSARALTPVYQALADSRIAAMRELSNFLQSKRYAKVCERLASPLTRKFPPDADLRRMAPRLIEPIIRICLRTGARLRPESPPTAFHRLRVRLKRLRYALEMLDPPAGKHASKMIKRLRKMQDELGEHQDSVNTGIWIRQFARTQPPPETVLAAGALLQYVGERRVKLAARALHQWKKIEHSGILIKVIGDFTERSQLDEVPSAE